MWFALSRSLAVVQSMVETWEIEWNSSMIEHGRDAGTMEFIFAKGGNLSDVNYVMFDTQDNTWEPLIKAVAERENSHPDIIRKNVPMSTQRMQGAQQQEQQEPFLTTRNHQAAQPFMGTAVRNPRQATNQFKTAQRMANISAYRDNPGARNAMQAGLYGTAAGHAAANTGRALMGAGSAVKNFAQDTAGPAMGRAFGGAKNMTGQAIRGTGAGIAAGAGKARDFMARKFPGVKQRMGNFMQGVGDTARHGMDALLGEKDATGKRVGDGVLARTVKRRGDQNELDRLQTGRANELTRQKTRASQGGHQSLRDEQMAQYQTDFDANEQAKQKLQGDIDQAGPTAGIGGLRRKIKELGDARREGARTVDPAVAAAGEAAKDAMEGGPVDSALTDSLPPIENPLTEEETPIASTEMPPPEAGAPQASPAALKPQEVYDQQIAGQYGEGETPYSSRSKMRAMGRALQSGSYEPGAFTPKTAQGRDAMAVLERMGVPRPEAAKTAVAAEKGDPKAKKVVEQALTEVENPLTEEEEPMEPMGISAPLTLSADNIDTRGWNLLMKQLAIR
jgi:hypothetical protein